jgi:polyferredoxin
VLVHTPIRVASHWFWLLFARFFFLFAFGVGEQSLAISIITRRNNLLFSSLSALSIRLLAVLLSIRIALIIAGDPCGRSRIRDKVCLYILPFALPPIGSGCPFKLFFTLYQEELLYEDGKDEAETSLRPRGAISTRQALLKRDVHHLIVLMTIRWPLMFLLHLEIDHLLQRKFCGKLELDKV